MYKFLTLPVLLGHFTSRNPVQNINSCILVSSKNPSVGSYQGWKDKTLTCYALTRSKGELMTEMWLLLKCPERIIWADFLFSWGWPPSDVFQRVSHSSPSRFLRCPPCSPCPPLSPRVCVQLRRPLCEAVLTRGRSFFLPVGAQCIMVLPSTRDLREALWL